MWVVGSNGDSREVECMSSFTAVIILLKLEAAVFGTFRNSCLLFKIFRDLFKKYTLLNSLTINRIFKITVL